MKEKFQMLQVSSHNWIMGIYFFVGKNNRKSEQKVTRFIGTVKNIMNKDSLLVNRRRNKKKLLTWKKEKKKKKKQ